MQHNFKTLEELDAKVGDRVSFHWDGNTHQPPIYLITDAMKGSYRGHLVDSKITRPFGLSERALWSMYERAAPLKLTDPVGPVRTVTRKELVVGRHGHIVVGESPVSGKNRIVVDELQATKSGAGNMREVAARLVEIAEFLEAQDDL